MSQEFVNLLVGLAVPLVTGFVGLTIHFSKKRERRAAGASQVTHQATEALTAISDASQDVVSMWQDLIEPIREENRSMRTEIELIKSEFESVANAFADYAEELRTQVIELGGEPKPIPPELTKHLSK